MREQVQLRIATGHDVRFSAAIDRVERHTRTRREFLRTGGAVGLAGLLAACTPRSSTRRSLPTRTTAHDARVAIVGAGLAGVTAAFRLANAGADVRLYEARDRVGGRCWTARGFPGGQTAEHGGEFIDTRHVHLRGLARELDLPLDDLWAGYPAHSSWPRWIGGRVLDQDVVQDQVAPIADAVLREAHRIGVFSSGRASAAAYSYGTATPAAVELDARSMADWLDEAVPGVVGTAFGAYLDELMAGWYGLDLDGLSALNWIDYYVIPAPGADERWHVRGGNDQVPNRAADALPDGVLHLEAPLSALVLRSGGGYELRFEGGAASDTADLVILAAPFTTLRTVDLTRSGLSAERLTAIDQLDMGADVKLLLGYDRRPFRFRVGDRVWSGGMEHTDPNFETWESSTDERGSAGLITVYAGGSTGASWSADVDHGPAPPAFAREIVGNIDDVVPGTAASFSGVAWLDLWTRDRWTGGSYAAFGPTQMTRFWGYTARPEGNVHFAGEHTSTYSQGYLNGGVESGQRAAIEVLRTLGLPVPTRIAKMPYSPVS
jgi:monoamine oxidase